MRAFGKPGDRPQRGRGVLAKEIEMWIKSILESGFSKMARTAKMTGAKPESPPRELAGLKMTGADRVRRKRWSLGRPHEMDDNTLLALSKEIREASSP